MDIQQVSEHTFACLMHNETANAGIVVTDRGPIVVDTLSTPALGHELAARVQHMFGCPPALVINTHVHFDHVFGNQAFAAPILAHHSLAPALATRYASQFTPEQVARHVAEHPEDAWMRDDLRVVYPHIRFLDRLVLDFGGVQIMVCHLGGHTPCLSVVHIPAEGVLFASDLLFMGRTPFMVWSDTARWIEALEELAEMNARVVIPGHGEPATAADVERFRQYIADLRHRIVRLHKQGATTEAVAQTELPRWSQDRLDRHQANLRWISSEVRGGERGRSSGCG